VASRGVAGRTAAAQATEEARSTDGMMSLPRDFRLGLPLTILWVLLWIARDGFVIATGVVFLILIKKVWRERRHGRHPMK
jgi:hypothetical protein